MAVGFQQDGNSDAVNPLQAVDPLRNELPQAGDCTVNAVNPLQAVDPVRNALPQAGDCTVDAVNPVLKAQAVDPAPSQAVDGGQHNDDLNAPVPVGVGEKEVNPKTTISGQDPTEHTINVPPAAENATIGVGENPNTTISGQDPTEHTINVPPAAQNATIDMNNSTSARARARAVNNSTSARARGKFHWGKKVLSQVVAGLLVLLVWAFIQIFLRN